MHERAAGLIIHRIEQRLSITDAQRLQIKSILRLRNFSTLNNQS
jgi:hypothetical protein